MACVTVSDDRCATFIEAPVGRAVPDCGQQADSVRINLPHLYRTATDPRRESVHGVLIQQAGALAARLDIDTGFRFGSVELMGRVGPAFGGEWRLIESVPTSAAGR